MTAKVRIKAGSVEFEYEGAKELGLAEIKDLFNHIEALFRNPMLTEGGQANSTPPPAPTDTGSGPSGSVFTGQKLHINSVAQKLNAKSAQDLAVAAAATLQLMERKEKFTRDDLLQTMKKATMHYNKSMGKNLSRTLNSIVGSKFNQVSDGVYSLGNESYQELASKLA